MTQNACISKAHVTMRPGFWFWVWGAVENKFGAKKCTKNCVNLFVSQPIFFKEGAKFVYSHV